MYKYNDAVKLFKFYSDKVIGRPLDETKGKSLLISHMKVEELEDHTFDVFCYGKGSISMHFFRDIKSVAKDLKLLSPAEILEEEREEEET